MLFYAIRERELLLNINELIAGFRFFPSYIRIGGLREDCRAGSTKRSTRSSSGSRRKSTSSKGCCRRTTSSAAHARRRCRHEGGCGRWGLVGPICRGVGLGLRRPQVLPLLRLRDLRLRRADADRRRRLRTVSRAHRGVASERSASAQQAIAAHHAVRCVGLRRSARSFPRRRTRSIRRWKR
jgi:Ni,Fe-hydrogenase III large subunit